uniref:hypothetical protein n=1 Tax=Algoriphagus sp. TaxID=1872435 RepID=UPI00404790FB
MNSYHHVIATSLYVSKGEPILTLTLFVVWGRGKMAPISARKLLLPQSIFAAGRFSVPGCFVRSSPSVRRYWSAKAVMEATSAG